MIVLKMTLKTTDQLREEGGKQNRTKSGVAIASITKTKQKKKKKKTDRKRQKIGSIDELVP